VTLVGELADGKFRALVGDPRLADQALGTSSPYALPEVYDSIASQLADIGIEVIRNPLVHWPTKGQKLALSRLKDIALQSNDEALSQAIAELVALGASDRTKVTVRSWHHITWNNCLVENTKATRTVFLPTFGYGDKSSLAALDQQIVELWEGLGYDVKRLGDFNAFAERQGVVHCIKKYLARGT
jgi:hypothetical protein